MTRYTGSFVVALSLAPNAFAKQSAHAPRKGDRPNIVVMIADDCTYRDLQCYGSVNSATPNINRLAGEGMMFTSFFQATPMSSPTRQCLMTGQYPIKNGAYPNHAFVRPGTKSVVQYMREAGYRIALDAKRHFSPETIFDYEFLSGSNADVDTSKIRPFINDATSDGTPFCLFVCSHQPHIPWDKGDVSVIDSDRLILPEYFVDTPETRECYRRYLAEVNYLDWQVGCVMHLLEKTGVADNTVFFFTSEQGNSMPFAKYTLYDMGVQTGMIVRWPGVVKPGSTCSALVEYVDMTPTLMDIAGLSPDHTRDGRSFLHLLNGYEGEFKTEVYAAQTTRGIINGADHYGIRSVRKKDFLYIRNLTPDAVFESLTCSDRDGMWPSWLEKAKDDPKAARLVYKYQHRPAEELYDIVDDRIQERNLADDSRYASIKAELSSKLDAWMAAQGDRGAQTEMEALEHQASHMPKVDDTPSDDVRLLVEDPRAVWHDGIFYIWDNGKEATVYKSVDLKHWTGPVNGKVAADVAGYFKLRTSRGDGLPVIWQGRFKGDGNYFVFAGEPGQLYIAFISRERRTSDGRGAIILSKCRIEGKKEHVIAAPKTIEPIMIKE